MLANPYLNYYTNQAGSGLSGYDGVRFQRRNGFFSNIFRSAILPVMKYLGRNLANTGIKVASDALSGENVLESLKTRGKETAQTIAEDAGNRLTKFAQTGTGRRRRFKRNNNSKRIPKSKSKKRRKQPNKFKKNQSIF
jgi:hypothetical protein